LDIHLSTDETSRFSTVTPGQGLHLIQQAPVVGKIQSDFQQKKGAFLLVTL
jgi:hypothetical protein